MWDFGPAWLIAGREFKAYATTASFWVALSLGPVMAAGVLVLSSTEGAPSAIQIKAPDGVPVIAALNEAGAMEGRKFVFSHAAAERVVIAEAANGPDLQFSASFPLSAPGRALVGRSLDLWAARRVAAGYGEHPPQFHISSAPSDSAASVRLVLVGLMWMVLTGSLGMLLQAVVRERANRALESLLASVTPAQLLVGKLVGVGAVSLLVVFAWLAGVTAAYEMVATKGWSSISTYNGAVGPELIAKALVFYALAFALFGVLTVGVGARAKDVASAQNLSRPMFGLLLLVFFAVLGGGAQAAPWLAYLPPFAPFIGLLVKDLSLAQLTGMIGLCVLCIGLLGSWATRRLSLA